MTRPNTIKFSIIINKILRKIGFQVIRMQTLENLVATEQKYNQLAQSDCVETPCSPSTKDATESRFAALETRTEQSLQNMIRYAMKAHWRTVDLIEQVSGADKPDTCPLCGHKASKDAFKEAISQCVFLGGRLLRHTCPSCDVIFGPQKMFALDSEMLDLDYRNLYQIYSEGDSTESIIRTFNLLNPVKDGVYLDFGCGGQWSEAISQLRQEGWNIFGFEPSIHDSSEFVFSKWEEIETKQFDGIFSHNVLEHLFEPSGTTKRLAQLLTPTGRIVHATPCFDYRYDFTHYHVFFFTGKSPEVLAKKADMQITNWVRDGEYIACTLQKVAE